MTVPGQSEEKPYWLGFWFLFCFFCSEDLGGFRVYSDVDRLSGLVREEQALHLDLLSCTTSASDPGFRQKSDSKPSHEK